MWQQYNKKLNQEDPKNLTSPNNYINTINKYYTTYNNNCLNSLQKNKLQMTITERMNLTKKKTDSTSRCNKLFKYNNTSKTIITNTLISQKYIMGTTDAPDCCYQWYAVLCIIPNSLQMYVQNNNTNIVTHAGVTSTDDSIN